MGCNTSLLQALHSVMRRNHSHIFSCQQEQLFLEITPLEEGMVTSKPHTIIIMVTRASYLILIRGVQGYLKVQAFKCGSESPMIVVFVQGTRLTPEIVTVVTIATLWHLECSVSTIFGLYVIL